MNLTKWADRPMIVIWEVTRRCALACRHCRAVAQPHRDPSELAGEEIESLLEQISEIVPRYLVLTGGDPATRSDLLSIARRATERGLRVAISPSATRRLLREDFSEWRRAGVQRISLSLDGANAATHDAFRGVAGTWEWTRLALEKAQLAGLEFQVNTTFSRSNLSEWDAFANVIEQMRPELWSVFLLVPTGRAQAEELPSAEQTESLWHRLADFEATTGVPVKTTEGPHFRRVLAQRGKERQGTFEPRTFAATNDGRGFVFVSHRGDIQPSGFLPITCGNVRADRLLDVYRNSEVFRRLRDPDQLEGKCSRCEYRQVCGGSRARAFAVHGNYLAEEPTCLYQPNNS